MTNMATQTSMNEWMYFLVEMVDFPAIFMYFLLEGIHYINFNFQTPKIDETQCNSSRWRMIMSKKKNLWHPLTRGWLDFLWDIFDNYPNTVSSDHVILLMEEMLHHLWCIKPWINNVINHRTYQLVHDLFHQQYGWYTGTQAMLISMCRAPKQLRKDKNGFLPTWVALYVHFSNGLSGRVKNVVALYGIEMVHMCTPPIMDGSLACYLPQEQVHIVHWSRLTQLRTKNTPNPNQTLYIYKQTKQTWFTLEQDIYSWPLTALGLIRFGVGIFLYTAVVPRSKTQL